MYFSTKKLISRLKYVAKKSCGTFAMPLVIGTPIYIKRVDTSIYCVPYGDKYYIFTLEQGKPHVFEIKSFSLNTLRNLIITEAKVANYFSFTLTSDIVRALNSFHRANYEIIQVKQSILGL